jgi:hypothetical protein
LLPTERRAPAASSRSVYRTDRYLHPAVAVVHQAADLVPVPLPLPQALLEGVAARSVRSEVEQRQPTIRRL